MEYLEWNDLIAGHFFNEEMSGREVLLYVNEDLISRLGEHKKAGLQDFVDAIKRGPPWATRSGFCQKALQACDEWRCGKFDYPPYIAYLAFFVLAAGTKGDFAVHAYYPRVWKLLGEDGTGQLPSFEQMIELWDDLEKWSRDEKQEEFGRFIARIRGKWILVGLPLSQTLLSEEERRQLPRVFESASIDPSDPPSSEVLPRLLIEHGDDHFEKRTLSILAARQGDEEKLKSALIEFVFEELANWDGSIAPGDIVDKAPVTNTGLKLCIEPDWVSNQARSYLRFKSGRPYPSGGLSFRTKQLEKPVTCIETWMGWSDKLKSRENGASAVLDGSRFNWTESLNFVDEENNWKARFKGASVRLFMPGARYGLPDWVEANRLDRNTEFIVGCIAAESSRLKEWGATDCEFFEERALGGLSSGWSFFRGRNARKSCSEIDVLSISTTVRLALAGGVRSGKGKGNGYLNFAPPRIVLENAKGNEEIKLNGRPLYPLVTGIPVWEIPKDSPIETPLQIEALVEGQTLRRVVRLQEPVLPASYETPWRDRFGRLNSNHDIRPRVQGALALPLDGVHSPYPPSLPTHLSRKIIFIGEHVGEISEWPSDPIPNEWHPVWALAKKGKNDWEANFCGLSRHLDGKNDSNSGPSNYSGRRKWQQLIWHKRKHIKQPSLRCLSALWSTFVARAERV